MVRILVVDDNPYTLDCCRQFLKAGGHEVVAAHSAIAALEALKNRASFDLVLTDYEMPFINGIELIKEIREAGIAIPIIMMAENPDVPENHGADALLMRPMGLVVLLARVDNLLKVKA